MTAACELRRAVWVSMKASKLHGRDGHAPFLRDAKSNFKETLVSDFECVDFVTCSGSWLMRAFADGNV